MAKDWIQEYYTVNKFQHMYRMDRNYKDIYKFYKEKYEPKMNEDSFKELCYEFNRIIANKIITKSFEFKLPFRLGSLRIKSEKQSIELINGKVNTKKMAIDWGASHKMWKDMYPDKTYREIMDIPNKKVLVHTNEHSNGYIMSWQWDKRLSNTKNQSLYFFRPVKGKYDKDRDIYFGRRGLSAWIKNYDRTNEYFE